MIIKSHSIMLGYRQYEALLRWEGKRLVLMVSGIGPISPDNYIKNGFRVIKASRRELQGLVASGYESSSAFLRHYNIKS